jgi:hypothetical protein
VHLNPHAHWLGVLVFFLRTVFLFWLFTFLMV